MFSAHIDKPRVSTSHTRTATSRSRQPSPQLSVLQRSADQRTLSQVLTPRLPDGVQAKLKVAAMNDPLEHEADRVADQVMRMPAGEVAVGTAPVQVSRKCAACDREDDDLQRKSAAAPPDGGEAAPPLVHDVLRSPGTAPDAGDRPPRWKARAMGAELLDGFALNSAALTKDHQERLAILAHTLKSLLTDYPGGVVLITGHTDATGSEQLNQALGEQRAAAVAKFLLDQGVPAAALVSLSSGEATLRVNTQSQEPRNRRAEVRFDPSAPRFPSSQLAVTTEQQRDPPNVDPGQVCKTRPELCEGKPPGGLPSDGTQLPARCPNTGNCSAVSTLSFGQQPAEFQQLLENSFSNAEHWFHSLDAERRFALVAIYNRFCQLGLSCHIRRIDSVVPGESLLSLMGVKVKVPGLSISVNFETDHNLALFDALTGSGIACRDAGIGGSLHPGQASLRQRTTGPGLHTSIGTRNRSDAHLDEFSSPNPKARGVDCTYDVPATAAHLGREIVAEKFRSILKKVVNGVLSFFYLDRLPVVPYVADYATDVLGSGMQVFPDFTLTPTVPQLEPPRQDVAPPPMAGITWRGPVRQKPPPLVPAELKQQPADVGRISDDRIESIRTLLESQIRPEALMPPQLRTRLIKARERADRAGPDEETALRAARDVVEREADYANAHDVAVDLAVAMARARLKQQGWVMLHLEHYGRYGGLDGNERTAVLAQIERIALLLRDQLPERAAGVNTIVVIFGSGHQAVRTEVRLPGWVAPAAQPHFS